MATIRIACSRLLTLSVLFGSLFVATTTTFTNAAPAAVEAITSNAALPEVTPGVPMPSDYHALTPQRLLDTRDSNVPVAADVSVDLQVTGVAGVPVSGVSAVVLNVTSTDASQDTFVTVFPSGGSRPLASNLNVAAGRRVANLVIAKVGVDGSVSIYNRSGSTHIVVDIQGWFADVASSYTPLTPQRLLDTRDSNVPVAADVSVDLQVTGVAGVPVSGVSAVVLNVTSTDASQDTFVTVFPSGGSRPLASNLNVAAGRRVANLVIAKVGVDGAVSIYNRSGSTHIVVDIQGWFSDSIAAGTVLEGSQYGWRFVPANMLLSPGESRHGNLVQTGLDGQPTGGALPQGVTFEMSGFAGNVTVTSTGGTGIQVTAGETIDTSVVAAQIPGTTLAPVMTVTVARLNPGVITIDDDAIAFPEPNLPKDASTVDVLNSDTSATGVGPFTWEQINARLLAPDSAFNTMATADVLNTVVRFPLVLRSAPPATGSLIVGSGGSSVLGKVVEPDGLPTLVSGDFSLVSVELVGPQLIYSDLHYDLQYDDLVAIGAAPAISETPPPTPPLQPGPSRTVHSPQRPAPLPAVDPTPTPDPNNQTVAAPGTVTSGGGGTTGSPDCKSKMLGNPQSGIAAAEFSPAVAIDFAPTLNAFVQINDGKLQGLQLEMGGGVTGTVSAKVKFQPTASFSIDCKIADYLTIEMAAPGPLAPFLDITGDAEQHFKIAVTIAGGPKAEPGISCPFKATLVMGFSYDWQSDTLHDLGKAEVPKPECTADPKPSVNAGQDGIGVSMEITIGIPLTAPLGVRVGGAIVQGIAKVLSLFNIASANTGKVEGLKLEAAPQLRFTWENFTNSMTLENAKSAALAELVGKATVEIQPLIWLTKIFGVAGAAGNNFSITLYQETLPLVNGYQALNPVDGGITATANGDDIGVTPGVYVQQDDQLVLKSVLGPSSGGLSTSFSVPELEWAKVYEKNDVGFLTESNLFDVSVIQSTGAQASLGVTTIKVSKTITLALCNEFRDQPRTFLMVANAPINLFGFTIELPAWGGKFSIQCVDGKVEWDPSTVDPLDFDNGATVQIKSKGSRDDTWKIAAKPDWLDVSPLTGDLAPNTDPAADPDAIDVNISTGTPGSVNCWDPRRGTVTVSTTNRGAADLTVTEDDPCYLKWDPVKVTGPGEVTASLVTKGRTNDATFASSNGFPDWLHLTSPIGSVPMPKNGGAEMSIPFTFSVDDRAPKCTVQLPETYDFTVSTATRGTATLTIIQPKVDPLTDCGLRFTPNELTGSGHSLMTVRDDDLTGTKQADWTIDPATVPVWLNVVPMTGTIGVDGQVQVNFAQLGTPFDPCAGRPERSTTVTANAEIPTGLLSSRTVSGQIKITRPAVPPANCPRLTGVAWGDPHLVSMDGVRVEGQILGEYVYGRSTAGTPDPFELVVRTQPTSGTTDPVAPTSVTAAALTYGGSTVEVYLPCDSNDVLVDHVVVDIPDGTGYQVNDTMTISRTGATIRIDIPSVTVTLVGKGYYINLLFGAALGTPMEGLLGSPDGDRDHEFVGGDGTAYLTSDISNNEVPQSFDFFDSWRLKDQSTSPFTRSYPEFGAPNPGFDQSILDTFLAQIDAGLIGMDQVCSGTITGRQRYGLALELSIGTPLGSLDAYSCTYEVSGHATSNGLPVGSLRVTLDAPGLHPCVALTGPDGRYRCMLQVDLAEVNAATGPLMPLTVSATASWPGLASVAASGSTEFTTKASVNAGPLQSAPLDLVVDPDSVPRLEATGTMTQNGITLAGTRQINVTAYDSSNSYLLGASEWVDVDIDTGHYSFTRMLPPTTTRVVLSTGIGTPVPEGFESTITDLHLGANAVVFDVVYTVPTVTVQGTLTDGVAGLPGTQSIELEPVNSLGAVLPRQYVSVTPDPVTGAYSVVVALPRATSSVVALVRLGTFHEEFKSAAAAVVDGTAVAELSVAYTPPTFGVSGSIVDEIGGALGVAAPLQVVYRNAAGNYIGQSLTTLSSAIAGTTYTASFPTPLGAATAQVIITAGVQYETFESPMYPLTAGANAVQFDVALAPVRLHVSGTLTDGAGTPLAGPRPVEVYFLNAGGGVVSYEMHPVTPDPITGAYDADFAGHRNAVKALVRVYLPINNETREADIASLSPGDNAFVFNVGFSPPVVTFSGHFTGVGGAPLAGPIAMHVQGHDDHFLTVFSQTRYITPDANGAYSFTIVMPSSTVSVNTDAQIGSIVEWYHTEEVPIVAGNNSVVLDADYRPPSATISGVMVSAPGVPLGAPFVSGPISVGVSAYDADGNLVRYLQPAITPGVGGAYSFDAALPRQTVSFEVRAYISGEQGYVQTFSGVVAGEHRAVNFDVVYNPPRLNVTGLAKKDGAFATGMLLLSIRRYSSPTAYSDTTQGVTIGANGVYSVSNIKLPVGTVKADLSVRLLDGAQSFTSTVDGLFDGELRDVVLDFDDVRTTVSVSGSLRIAGAPALPNYVSIQAFDASNATVTVSNSSRYVTPDANGDFSGVQFVLPPNAKRVVVFTFMNSAGWSVGSYASVELADVQPQTDNPVSLVAAAQGVRVTGSLVDAGVRVPLDGDATEITFTASYELPGSSISTGVSAVYEADNTFVAEMMVPLDALSFDLTVTNAGLAHPTTHVEPLTGDVTTSQWDIDIQPVVGTTFVLLGALTDGGVPITDQPEISFDVIGYDFVDMDTPYTQVWQGQLTTVPFPDGTYAVGWNDVLTSVTMIRVTVKVNGADEGWTRGYTDLVISDVNQRTFDIDLGASRLRYRGNVMLDGCPAPLVFYREFWTFTSEPTEQYDWDTHTWPGGTLAARVLVIPDPTAPYVQDAAVHMPADTTWIGTVYSDHNSGGTGLGTFPPNAIGEAQVDETIHC